MFDITVYSIFYNISCILLFKKIKANFLCNPNKYKKDNDIEQSYFLGIVSHDELEEEHNINDIIIKKS